MAQGIDLRSNFFAIAILLLRLMLLMSSWKMVGGESSTEKPQAHPFELEPGLILLIRQSIMVT